MSAVVTLAEALRPEQEAYALSWGVVSAVIVSPETTVVEFSLFGAPTLDTASATNLKLAKVGTLNTGDKIMVARTGSGAWVILDRVATPAELED